MIMTELFIAPKCLFQHYAGDSFCHPQQSPGCRQSHGEGGEKSSNVNSADSMKYFYNLGFCSVSAGGVPFCVYWWGSVLRLLVLLLLPFFKVSY